MPEQRPDPAYWKKQRRRRKRIVSTILTWLLVLFIIIAIIFGIVTIIMSLGGRSLRNKAVSQRPIMDMVDESASGALTDENGENAEEACGSSTPEVTWQEGWVRHNGKIYEYNEDIMNFLVLGIDELGKVKESTTLTGGGQSDAIFLVIVNPDTKEINLLAVNRDTMTDIRMYGMGPDGSDTYTYGQLATQHGFGDGKELSCELTRDTVSALFYDLPIHGYAAVNMGAISQLNDAIGGVEVTVLEDLTKASKNLVKDQQVTLKGKDAYLYVKWRDTKIFESNRGRLARQKQYLGAFCKKLIQAVKQDITLPVTLYQKLSEYVVTDFTTDEVAYLAGQLLDYSMGEDAVYTLEGTTVQGEVYEEFYPDQAAMKELMIELFYREVEE